MARLGRAGPRLILAATGIAGIAVQAMLVRELISVLAGDELVAALLLAAWLLGEAAGALVGARIPPGRTPAVLPALAVLSLAGGIAALPAAALLRPLFGLLPGELVPLHLLAPSVLALALLPAAAHSALFVAASNLLPGPGAPGRAYLWRGLGTASGGLLLYLGLVGRLPAIGIAAVCGIPLAVSLALLSSAPARWSSATLALALAALVVLSPGLERWAWSAHWPGQKVLAVRDSPYGKTVTLGRGDNRTVLVDGAVVAEFPFTTTEPDELLAHLCLLAHPSPRSVLIVGALPGGLLAEALKHPVESVTCVTLDPVVLRAAVRGGGDAVGALLVDPRVSVASADPAQFLRRGTARYDCIILPAGPPQSLGANRLATVEFYRLCRARLSPGGVVAVRGPDLPVVDRIALSGLDVRRATLALAFGTVQLVPSAPAVLLASNGTAAPLLTADSARSRLAARGIRTLTLAVQLGRLEEAQAAATTALPALPPNTTAQPSERFTALLATLQRSAPTLARAWLWLRLRGWLLLVVGLALAAATFLFVRRRRRFAVRAALVSSGFAGSGIALLNLFALQAVSGAAYSGIILLFAAFTAGNAAGAWWGNLIPPRLAHRYFIGAEFALALTAVLLAPAARGALPAVFPAFAALAGACLGLQFAVAGRDDAGRTPARRAGPLAALDLGGGVLGALLLPVFVLPAFGLAAAGAGIVGAKLATAIALVLAPGRD
ncbi:MAG: hypothetical protein R6X13_06855 [bacterium]